MALVASSILRLDLYVEAYGLTRLRVAAFVWMGLVAAGLGLMLWQIGRDLAPRWLVARSALLSVVTLWAMCFVNVDGLIARWNLARPDLPDDIRDAVKNGGELTKELYELRELVATGCLDVLQPDAICAGGITGLRKIAILAREHNLDFTPHTWGDGLGLVANAHLAAASQTKYLEFPYDPPNWLPAVRDFPFVRPVGVDAEGWLDLGEAPGMGMELDEERLAKTRVG